MNIYVDTRQKAGKHRQKHADLSRLGCELIPKKLEVGDYMAQGNDAVSVDTKQDIQELYTDVVRERARFTREVRRAHRMGIHLWVLIEDAQVKNLLDLERASVRYGALSCRAIMERCIHLHKAYGTEFIFCSPDRVGEKIAELLSQNKDRGEGGDYAEQNTQGKHLLQ